MSGNHLSAVGAASCSRGASWLEKKKCMDISPERGFFELAGTFIGKGSWPVLPARKKGFHLELSLELSRKVNLRTLGTFH